MRITKYRVWSKKNKKMYPVISLAHPTETGFDSLGIHDEVADVDTWLEGHEYELMQFTGLKDKNDIEIFEGDIVRVWAYGDNYETDPPRFICEIQWSETRYIGIRPDKHVYEVDYEDDFEVLGNRFVNPELVETP